MFEETCLVFLECQLLNLNLISDRSRHRNCTSVNRRVETIGTPESPTNEGGLVVNKHIDYKI